MADILFARSQHDTMGPLVTFAGNTPRGTAWLKEQGGGDGSYIIEDENAVLLMWAAEADGISIKPA